MSFVRFHLWGEMALWRNYQESMGAYSCLGPAPSNLAGLMGAALGFASPCSQGGFTKRNLSKEEQKQATARQKKLPWPVSPELLAWEREVDLHVACRWTGGVLRRFPWNVNGIKDVSKWGTLRMQQQVIMSPSYDVVVKLPRQEADRLAEALKAPEFPLYLGSSFCRAIVTDIQVEDQMELKADGTWAFHEEVRALGEATPFSQHCINAEISYERIARKGYWIYPTSNEPGILINDPFVRTWTESAMPPDETA